MAAGAEVVDARVVRTRRDVLRAALDELVEGGWDAVTHARVAARAGYSKATLYTHWPDRLALVRDAFADFGDMPHHTPTGDVRGDLVGELTSFRTAMRERRLDRALAVLAERAGPVPELVDVRARFVEEGERPLREVLAGALPDGLVAPVSAMLCGLVVHSVLLRGEGPSDADVESAVDLVLAGAGVRWTAG
ncbi:TetR/AcrR family transcriptional regulator [Aquipuribacter sp. SD81]|uniref:TetR/AcrR family transcriptional regulator n=1 Tax=Aquipuribacter sp. SD81 TaxID=3127703 RepID=UPI0030181017